MRWSSVLNSDGQVGEFIELTDQNSKGRSGRIIPLNKDLRKALIKWHVVSSDMLVPKTWPAMQNRPIISTCRSMGTSSQVIVNALRHWYVDLGYVGASSHSGRRTFITNAAKQVFAAGGSMRDVQELAGHKSLAMTQRYIEGDAAAKRRLVDLV